MLVLGNPVQPYAWGATHGMAELLGTPPSGGPEAELWVGAHPAAPSRTREGTSLETIVAADPERVLGPEVRARFGDRLPYLLKVLSIGAPLSVQLHPSEAQARVGFAREEADGWSREDPRRCYRDPHAKPEVLVALVPTWVLVGFRPGRVAAAALRQADPRLGALAGLVVDQPDARRALEALLGATGAEREALAAVAARVDDCADPALTWVRRLAVLHPGDPSALVPLLLELRRLAVGEGLFLPAGVPHAYLHGAGVELMGASDNVVRGGLTPKHVDREELVRLLAPAAVGAVAFPAPTAEAGRWHHYEPDVPELALHRIALAPGTESALPTGPSGPALLLATEGSLRVTDGAGAAEAARPGEAVLVEPHERATATLLGPAVVWCATVAS